MPDEDISQATDQFYAALNSMLAGELSPLEAIWSQSDDVSNMSPFGGKQVSWAAVREQFAREAAMLPGGHVTPEEILTRRHGEMGYSLCIECADQVQKDGQPVSVRHRATNIFRREGDEWKLVHHHTDYTLEGYICCVLVWK